MSQPKFRCDFCLEIITNTWVVDPKDDKPRINQGWIWFSKGENQADWHTICVFCHDIYSVEPIKPHEKVLYEYSHMAKLTSELKTSVRMYELLHVWSWDYQKDFGDYDKSREFFEKYFGLTSDEDPLV